MIKKLNTFCLVLLFGIFVHSKGHSDEAIREIDNASKEVRNIIESHSDRLPPTDFADHADAKSISRLESALRRGEEVNSSLKEQVEEYKELVEEYKTEKAELLRIQTALASGLIGALVTAIVAITGAIVSAKNSKSDRDLKRLYVIEKARELIHAGVNIPKDIELNYIDEIESKGVNQGSEPFNSSKVS